MALTCLKGVTECGNNSVKKTIYATPAVKGLRGKYDNLMRKDFMAGQHRHSYEERTLCSQLVTSQLHQNNKIHR